MNQIITYKSIDWFLVAYSTWKNEYDNYFSESIVFSCLSNALNYISNHCNKNKMNSIEISSYVEICIKYSDGTSKTREFFTIFKYNRYCKNENINVNNLKNCFPENIY